MLAPSNCYCYCPLLLLQVFRAALGPSHPRTEVAARNLEHMRHKCVQLEMRYHIPQPKPKPPPKSEIPFGHGPRCVRLVC